ncbi:MAG: NAD-dependent epimerase/dehydratase family protein [Rhodothalassiaceae bacterium]
MTHAFVTGGTGFIGQHLIDVLTERGISVSALHRPDSRGVSGWSAAAVTPVQGDLTRPDSLIAAMPDGVDLVFHVAADTSPWRGHAARQRRVNVGGTEAVLEAMRVRKAGRLVHVSTVAVWGHHDEPVHEDLPQKGATHWVGYVRTKYEAERRVKAATDIDAVICNPGHVLGKYDAGNWGRLFRLIETGQLPGVPPGAGSFANGRQVAEALVAAALRGARGENYLLGGPHMRFAELARLIADMVGKPAPRPLPAAALKAIGQINHWISRITGKPPDLTPESAYFVCHDERIDSSKAIRDLGYREIPVAQSLAECHAWQRQAGI